jgi:tetratricopeptide (TPR) repeat protein
MMRKAVLWVSLVVSAGVVAAQDTPKTWDRCGPSNKDTDERIFACNALIESGLVKRERLAVVYLNRADAYDDLERYDLAIPELTRAIHFDPRNELAYEMRSTHYQELHEYKKSLKDVNAAIQLAPGTSSLLVVRAWDYIRLGKPDQAMADLNERLRLVHDDIRAVHRLGECYMMKHQYREAIKEFSRAIAANPNADNSMRLRGLAYLFLSENEAAAVDFKRSTEAKTHAAEFRVYTALLLFITRSQMGQADTADLTGPAARLREAEWPRPIIDYYVGKITDAELLSAARDSEPDERKGHVRTAGFFIGEHAILEGDPRKAEAYLKSAARHSPKFTMEREIALFDLKRLAKD